MIKAVRQKKRRKRRLYFVGLLVVLLAAAGFTLQRLSLSLQDISRIVQLAAGKITDFQSHRVPDQPVLRGTVYDRNLNELSVSYQLFTLYAHPAELSDRFGTARKLAAILNMDAVLLVEQLRNVQPVIELADDLDRQQANDVEALQLDGVYCRPVEKRYYPAHTAAAHLLGFTSSNVGLSGLEALYEPVLHPGEFRNSDVEEVDFGNSHALGRTSTDILLTLDLELQRLIEQQLRTYRDANGAVSGIGLAMEPSSGRVLAMASQPSFDPNYFWQADEQQLRNQVYAANFHFGLIRPFMVTAAAIQEQGLNGQLLPQTVSAPDYGLTEDRLDQYVEKFALQAQVLSPFSPSVEEAKAADGKVENGVRMSGCQLGIALASFINGGSRIEPYFLDSVYDHTLDSMFHRTVNHSPRKRIVAPADGIHLRRQLLLHSPYSTNEGVLFAGDNTEIVIENGFSDYQRQELLFIAVPRKQPSIFLLMAVDYKTLDPMPAGKDVQTQKEDLTLIGRKLLPVLAAYGSFVPKETRPAAKDEDNYRRFFISRRLELPEPREWLTEGNETMPELTGLSLRKGLQKISPFHLKVSVKGSGRIVAQHPSPGAVVSRAGVCELTLKSQK